MYWLNFVRWVSCTKLNERTLKRADSEHALEIMSVSERDVEDDLSPSKKSRAESVLYQGRYLRIQPVVG